MTEGSQRFNLASSQASLEVFPWHNGLMFSLQETNATCVVPAISSMSVPAVQLTQLQ